MSKHDTLIANSDYETVRAAIAYLSQTAPDEADLPRFSRALGITAGCTMRPTTVCIICSNGKRRLDRSARRSILFSNCCGEAGGSSNTARPKACIKKCWRAETRNLFAFLWPSICPAYLKSQPINTR